MNTGTEVKTGEVRFSYVHLMKPYSNNQNSNEEPKYSATILVPKTDVATKAAIDAAIEAAKRKGAQTIWNGVLPPIVPIPVHDGDGVRVSDGMPFEEECKGHWVFTANAYPDHKPVIVDAAGGPILSEAEIYSGMYGRAIVEFRPYQFNGKKGIRCSLTAVQKLRDGEALGNGPMTVEQAAQAFGVYTETAQAFGAPAPQQASPGIIPGASPQPVLSPQAQAFRQPAVRKPVQPTQAYGQPVQYQAGAQQIDPITGLPY